MAKAGVIIEEQIEMERKQVTFSNGNAAWVVVPPRDASCREIRQALAVPQPEALLLVVGGAKNMDDGVKDSLLPLFSEGIAALAAEKGALVIDGGTKAGVMEMMGQGVAEQGRQSVLLGIAPEEKVDCQGQAMAGASGGKTELDPNHSHFVLVAGSKWGDETATMFGLAEEFAQAVPVVTVLVNGGEIAKQEVLQSVQHRWPVVVITGSGLLADEIAGWWKQKTARPSFLQKVLPSTKTALNIQDRDMAEIMRTGDIYLFSYKARAEALRGLLKYLFLKQEAQVLAQVKEREAVYATLTGEHQNTFKRLQVWILGLGVLATILALGQIQLESVGWLKAHTLADGVFHFFVVLVPIVVTVVLGITTHFKWGSKWVLLRSSREALKQEIFRYRTRTGIYVEKSAGDASKAKKSAEQRLVERVKLIVQRLMQTEVNTAVLPLYVTPRVLDFSAADTDDGFSKLTPDGYIKFRLDDQVSFYKRRAAEWDRELKRYRSLAIIANGIAALLAAISIELWLPLATSLAATFLLYLEYMQVVNTLTKYNQAAINLEDVKGWWTALPESEKAEHKSFNKLVEATEKILESEQESWVQNMQNALDKLYKKDATRDGSGEEGE